MGKYNTQENAFIIFGDIIFDTKSENYSMNSRSFLLQLLMASSMSRQDKLNHIWLPEWDDGAILHA